jgi:putative cardiolipin synthase
LLTDALMRAGDRGVRVRILIDDGETVEGDEEVTALATHPSIELRIFNPFAYRGHTDLLRSVGFVFNFSRLDYQMHNKLLVVDNAIALIGGRNIGDQYFQVDPESQFADDDVFAAGPIAQKLSRTFDEFWNNALSIPAAALSTGKPSHTDSPGHRAGIDQPVNCYRLEWRRNAAGRPAHLVWFTEEGGKGVEYTMEPARNEWSRFKVNALSLLPIDDEL